MINLISHQLQKTILFFSLLMSLVVLQGCGSERDTPFIDPDSSSASSSSGRGKAVTITQIDKGDSPFASGITDERKFITMSNQARFDEVWPLYAKDTTKKPVIDFAVEQVVLLDIGRTCPGDKLKFNNYSAFEESQNSVVVVFDFVDADKLSSASNSSVVVVAAASESNSSSSGATVICGAEDATHPYRFYSVKTRDFILFEESVPAP
jgi:hypothetical protein